MEEKNASNVYPLLPTLFPSPHGDMLTLPCPSGTMEDSFANLQSSPPAHPKGGSGQMHSVPTQFLPIF